MSDPDKMVPIGMIADRDMTAPVPVHRDYDTVMIGLFRFDLDSIGQLQVALDLAVTGIRAYLASPDLEEPGDA